MNTPVALRAAATPTAPALVLRPWLGEDVTALVEACRDPALRRWTSHVVNDEADGERWVRTQQRGWAAGDRFAFAVLETRPDGTRPDGVHERLVGHAVVKEVASGKPSAEVGYWTAANARGKGVAPRSLQALTDWAFDTFAAGGLERLELLHPVGNPASCRVAQKSRYGLDRVLPAAPPSLPGEGHLHIRRSHG
ncbi:GNAT family N-acetyltransferase [Streptomyces sp. NPDC020141]|uniref:GNAT family N-acetyltransferase n=1 Tax=Streptomyces sp. NPDC020141 TaxID=3365065 RepID=UPI00378C22B5